MDIVFSIIFGIFDSILNVWNYIWWLVLPLVLFLTLWDLRLKYLSDRYIKNIKWKFLEIRIPKENLKTPKAMEQIFAAAHSIYTKEIKGYDKYVKGKVAPWMSFEMVGHGGGIHFYLRIPADYKNLMESAIFAQYGSAEINEVEDYINSYPAILPNDTYQIWGTDYILAKDDPYPLQTYVFFEDKEEERRIDPLSVVAEAMSKLKSDETIWLQYMIRSTEPAISDYKNKAEEIINKILGRDKKAEKKSGLGGELYLFARNLIMAPAEHPTWGAEAKKEDAKRPDISSGEKDIVKAIENKVSKLAFECIIRFVYIDKKDAFSRLNIAAVSGAFKQFNTENLNALKPNGDVTTNQSGWIAELFNAYKQKVEYLKKRKIYFNYRYRIMIPKASIYSIEELATLFHIPSAAVGAPKMRRLEAKKSEPPAELPIG